MRFNTWKTLRFMQFITVVLVMLVAGVLWGTWFSLSRSIDALPAQVYLSIGQTMIHNLARPMSILMPLTMLSFVVLLALLWRQRRSLAFFVTLLGLGGMLATIAITLAVEVPIDNQTKVWTLQTLPANWQALRHHWGVYHLLRTVTVLLAFGCTLWGVFMAHSITVKVKPKG